MLKCPYEAWNKTAKHAEKLLERDIPPVLQMCAGAEGMSKAEAIQQLDAMTARLAALKRKLESNKKESETQAQRCRQRIDHADEGEQCAVGARDAAATAQWEQMRVDRVLADYLLREGLFEAAQAHAAEAGIVELVDTAVFVEAARIAEALRRRDCGPALQWAGENRSRLKKLKSTLELQLRIQEFVELIRRNALGEAVAYARKHLSPLAGAHLSEVQHAMGALAYPCQLATTCDKYEPLFAEARWTQLEAQLIQDTYAVHSLTPVPLLEVVLEAGLSALKTPFCESAAEQNSSCPTCQSDMAELAAALPYAHHIHSRLVCRLSGAVMDENNPPMMLPNGNVYSREALQALASKNGGSVVDPRGGATFRLAEAKKLFIS
eukprot:TRINITY_DN9155_c0_g1_i1.p2 TRINITY_DN9155_c0_g1~~TRINITY_DN9155_c0_g1_i1.p2  ORF type:complete len:379 (+),score=116.93 TRINITY_DN9155_c0_g1_i1:79-1215(+)